MELGLPRSGVRWTEVRGYRSGSLSRQKPRGSQPIKQQKQRKAEQPLEAVQDCLLVKQSHKTTQLRDYTAITEVPECIINTIHIP